MNIWRHFAGCEVQRGRVWGVGGLGLCVFNLWCKVDVLILNSPYEIFTHDIVGRE